MKEEIDYKKLLETSQINHRHQRAQRNARPRNNYPRPSRRTSFLPRRRRLLHRNLRPRCLRPSTCSNPRMCRGKRNSRRGIDHKPAQCQTYSLAFDNLSRSTDRNSLAGDGKCVVACRSGECVAIDIEFDVDGCVSYAS